MAVRHVGTGANPQTVAKLGDERLCNKSGLFDAHRAGPPRNARGGVNVLDSQVRIVELEVENAALQTQATHRSRRVAESEASYGNRAGHPDRCPCRARQTRLRCSGR